ncbi:MAG: glycosyltransferase family 9 protein [Dokdonella sp.]
MSLLSDPLPAAPGEAIQELRRRVARALLRRVFGQAERTSAANAPLSTRGIHRILVCRISHTLGNTLLLTPLLREIQATYPGAEIEILTRSPVAEDIYGAFFNVRRIHCLPRHGFRAPWQLLRLIRLLRRERFDLAIDSCVRSQSDRIGVMLAKATWKLGYIDPRKSGTLTHGVEVPANVRHVGQLPVYLLRSALGKTAPAEYPPLDIGLTPDEREQGHMTLARVLATAEGETAKPRIIGVFANATGVKNFGSDWWLRFAGTLAARFPNDRIVEIIPASGRSLLDNRYPTVYCSGVRKLAQSIAALDVFISADCGVMHLACAAGTPTRGIFAVTDPVEWGPYGAGDAVIDARQKTPEAIAAELVLPDHSAPQV